ncbi:polysaccharide deacetylase family protein [Heliobacterium gestii]|uniref:Polysaccharide deacetylase family protein n=1 Tax=Heliomicrobium gestii TaxID=2699 RepID=A0A845LFZ8_HELGE|nr:polysaccharide deacetylase family protein [Heliomicrobium gestii]MBM7867066.1 peptidoglycan-N-acetylmuramic acid deacetylase [Heliomicrobium gestii]MZP43519.1 polysaccharide deacetylase family protein [Heliomicrobium gestii]
MKRGIRRFALFLLFGLMAYLWLQPLPLEPDEQTPAHFGTSPNSAAGKYGWGFVRSENEVPPYVPEWQKALLKEYGAAYLGDNSRKSVAITFDMGYELEGATPRILETLAAYNAKATFFLAGHWVKTQPDLLRRMVAEGHTVANHTWNHPSLPEISTEKLTEEILSLHRGIQQASGTDYQAKYLRPPKGEFSRKSLESTKNLGYRTIFWSISSVDWLPSSRPQQVYQDVVNQLHPGAIILLHGNSKAVVEALEGILKNIQERGYAVETLDQLLPPLPEATIGEKG